MRRVAALMFAFALLAVGCGEHRNPAEPASGAPAGSTEARPQAASRTVTYSGQGLVASGASYVLGKEVCGTENGAEVDGPYLLWVLAASQASSATIAGPWGSAPMVQSGNGALKFVSGWYDPSTLIGSVSASFTGMATAQLVLSHGCSPSAKGAWCSPGYWHNASDTAWALTGFNKTDFFNPNVHSFWFGATFAANPTLFEVVNSASLYSGAPNPGTSGYALNAFNATGAFLTDHLPGYKFDWDVMLAGGDDACPIDRFGKVK